MEFFYLFFYFFLFCGCFVFFQEKNKDTFAEYYENYKIAQDGRCDDVSFEDHVQKHRRDFCYAEEMQVKALAGLLDKEINVWTPTTLQAENG